jgi:hypothetical protein
LPIVGVLKKFGITRNGDTNFKLDVRMTHPNSCVTYRLVMVPKTASLQIMCFRKETFGKVQVHYSIRVLPTSIPPSPYASLIILLVSLCSYILLLPSQYHEKNKNRSCYEFMKIVINNERDNGTESWQNGYLAVSFASGSFTFSSFSSSCWRRALSAAEAAAGEIFARGEPFSTDSSSELTCLSDLQRM